MVKKILFLACLFPSIALADAGNLMLPVSLQQNAFKYLSTSNKPLLSRKQQQKKAAYFRHQYYFQWSNQASNTQFCYVPGVSTTCQSVKDLETGTINYYQTKTGYDQHYNPHTATWLNPIAGNMDLDNFPNLSCGEGACLGIMVQNAQVRSMPTHDAFYNDFIIPGEGYPFDYIQLSDMWLGTPVMIVQHSKDCLWFLVKSQGVMGWVPKNAVAFVKQRFVKRWQALPLMTSMARDQELFLGAKSLVWSLGSLLVSSHGRIGAPVKTSDGLARIQFVSSLGLSARAWPLALTPRNFGSLINTLDGMPYGWGGNRFYSDCSGLMRRLFASFGVWLPRNSSFQTNYSGFKYSLAKDSVAQRKAWLIDHQGPARLRPLLTLVSYGHSAGSVSHVSLYLGSYQLSDGQHVALIFHAPWGAHFVAADAQTTGRAILGQSLISPIGFGGDEVSAFAQNNDQLSLLWGLEGFNVIDLARPYVPQKTHANTNFEQKIQRYLIDK